MSKLVENAQEHLLLLLMMMMMNIMKEPWEIICKQNEYHHGHRHMDMSTVSASSGILGVIEFVELNHQVDTIQIGRRDVSSL